MEDLIDMILEMHAIGCKIDERVPTCMLGEAYKTEWHIYGYENFVRVAEELNNGEFEVDEDLDGSAYAYRPHFIHRGVYVFCLTNNI